MSYYEAQTVESNGIPYIEYRTEPDDEEHFITIEFKPLSPLTIQPQFTFGEQVFLKGTTDSFLICALELVETHNQSQWLYGIRLQQGTRELIWFQETELTRSLESTEEF
ncbi:hypothetical protein C7H19_20125 [Aphanothece hegewaldii CCALA 016]|uniref:Uncharacterized protein n=1 Tax=Aphanothece hegewaldii CCALA 016 TaxID=2107694 RepID=A0A2T1LT52_9CHRO|nr:hypothetical protein [Aphanothece hegewaldii]PSF33478.1 hypothetical protein C7H19_20125 [Aphanothece hegewaldii CCALA 016]